MYPNGTRSTEPAHPLQSPEWEEFRAKTHKVSRVNGLLIIWSKIPKTPWYFGYCPKSRMPTQDDLEEIKKLGLIGVRFEPDELEGVKVTEGLVRGRHFFTDQTFYLDLTKTEDQLLAAMQQKARYNIRLAQKHGVQIVEDNSDAAFAEYWKLMEQTTQRQGFFAHDYDYHKNMWMCMKDKIAHLFLAKYKDEILAAWIVFKYGDKIYYPYGASSYEHREVMAPSLMLWETARWGKQQGAKIYDLWVADEGKGFTKFKQQFGPKLVRFVGTWDLITNPLAYWPFRIAEEIRWAILKWKT